jgi:hypothetical protein
MPLLAPPTLTDLTTGCMPRGYVGSQPARLLHALR